jgi:predicted nucleotidyltransferase
MQSLPTILNQLKTSKGQLQKRYPIKMIGVFGSLARGEAHDESDVDIVVEFSGPIGIEFVDLADELEQLLGSKVDLVSRNAIRPAYWAHIESDVVYV